MHILEEWRLRDIEQKADKAYGKLYEIDSLRSDVGGLERALREISSEIFSLRDELQALQESLRNEPTK